MSEEESSLVELIGRLSYAGTFVEEAVAAGRELWVEKAYGVMAQYDFTYDPVNTHKPVRDAPVFLGCFPWHD